MTKVSAAQVDYRVIARSLRVVLAFTEHVNNWCAHACLSSSQLVREAEVLIDEAAERFLAENYETGIDSIVFKALLPANIQGVEEVIESVRRKMVLVSSARRRSLSSQVSEHTLIQVASSRNAHKGDRYKSTYVEEFFNPIAMLQDHLMLAHRCTIELADHHIQHWLRNEFAISYNTSTKYALAALCKRINVFFYETDRPSRANTFARLPVAAVLAAVIGEIEEVLAEFEPATDREILARRAVGVYLFLRFSQIFQWRVHLIGSAGSGLPEGRRNKKGAVPLTTRICLTAIRPLEYSYLQARVFGFLSDIPGLDYVFRGGLLPSTHRPPLWFVHGHPGAGKTALALSLMASFAKTGRVAVFFSFEESNADLVDKLVALNLIDHSRYELVEATADSLESQLQSERRTSVKTLADTQRGLLILHGQQAPLDVTNTSQRQRPKYSLPDAIARYGETLKAFPWRFVGIDGIAALEFSIQPDSSDPIFNRRQKLGSILNSMTENGFGGIITGESGETNPNSVELAYLVECMVEAGQNESHRWIRIDKCRNQNIHRGPHAFHLGGKFAVTIFPASSAVRSRLRTIEKVLPSKRRFIPLPKPLRKLGLTLGLPEKTSMLILGEPGTGKPDLALTLATEPSWNTITGEYEDVDNVLLITFRLSEAEYLRSLEKRPFLEQRWMNQGTSVRTLRSYSVGSNFTPGQFLEEFRQFLKDSSRKANPVRRIVFDHVESAEILLPSLSLDRLFWPTLLDAIKTEPVTSFFVVNEKRVESVPTRALSSGVDYCIRVEGWPGNSTGILEKENAIWVQHQARKANFTVSNGEIIGPLRKKSR